VASCRQLSRGRLLVTINDGTTILSGIGGNLQVLAGPPATHERLWEEVQLAGCKPLLAAELANRLLDGRLGVRLRGRYDRPGFSALRLVPAPTTAAVILHGSPPHPVAIEIHGRRLDGWSMLLR
jgi:hypothetical protein